LEKPRRARKLLDHLPKADALKRRMLESHEALDREGSPARPSRPLLSEKSAETRECCSRVADCTRSVAASAQERRASVRSKKITDVF
jgi:hypothetical protein